jgi:Sporulation protein and related proteins
VESYLGEISGKIASLTAKQQALLAEKTGTFQTTVGEVPLADDPAARPDFDPGFRPAWAGFSFGAPHRKGLSQYGAFGRAKAGQNYEAILKAYFGDVRVEKRDLPATISVQGFGELSFEDNYLKGIAEMPAQWGDEGGFEALKAQVIAPEVML